MIGIVDYGCGNVRAILNIYEHAGIAARPVREAVELRAVDRLILPGVGSFDWAMTRLNESGMREALDTCVLKEGMPVLGICVGMQMMMEGSQEGMVPGLGWIKGGVRKFDDITPQDLRLPHMGWNDVRPADKGGLFEGCGADLRFYFLHSYVVVPKETNSIYANAEYGVTFSAAVRDANVFGVQFHPEKSHHWGIRVLENFERVTRC